MTKEENDIYSHHSHSANQPGPELPFCPVYDASCFQSPKANCNPLECPFAVIHDGTSIHKVAFLNQRNQPGSGASANPGGESGDGPVWYNMRSEYQGTFHTSISDYVSSTNIPPSRVKSIMEHTSDVLQLFKTMVVGRIREPDGDLGKYKLMFIITDEPYDIMFSHIPNLT